MTPGEEKVFRDAMATAGVPQTDTALKGEFQTMADNANLTISNNSEYSAFWVFVTASAIEPVKWLNEFIVTTVMPAFFVKTASGAFLDLLAWGYDITRKPATKAVGNLVFKRNGTSGALAIPAGTRARTVEINGKIFRMETIAEAVIPEGSTSVTVQARAMEAGAAYNLGTSYYVLLDSDIAGIISVTNTADWLQVPGADEETDDSLRLRIKAQFSAVGDWHTDAKYRSMIAKISGFSPDKIYFDHEIPRGPGSADAYVLFDAGTIPDAYLTAVNDYIQQQGNHGHGDDLVVKALPETTHDVAVRIIFKANVTEARKTERLAQMQQAIRCAFRENAEYAGNVTQTWAFSRFSFSRLDYELHTLFPEIHSLHWGQDDIISELDIPRLGTLTIT